MAPACPIRNTSLSVLLTHNRPVFATGTYFGGPVNRISSPGRTVVNTLGTADDASGFPGRFARTSFQLSSAGSFLKLSGRVPAADQGPLTSLLFSQLPSFLR